LKKLRNTSTFPPLTPAVTLPPQSEESSLSDSLAATLVQERRKLQETTKTLRRERKQRIGMEAMTLRYVASLERQVGDLRDLYLSTIRLPISENREKTTK
jgi:hypothetical protein